MLGAGFWVLGAWFWVLGARCPVPLGAGLRSLCAGAGCSMLGAGLCSVLGAGLGAGCWVIGPGCCVLGAGTSAGWVLGVVLCWVLGVESLSSGDGVWKSGNHGF